MRKVGMEVIYKYSLFTSPHFPLTPFSSSFSLPPNGANGESKVVIGLIVASDDTFGRIGEGLDGSW